MVDRYSPRGRFAAETAQRTFVYSYTPSEPSDTRSLVISIEEDVTPIWVDAMLCAIGAAMFLSNLVVLSHL